MIRIRDIILPTEHDPNALIFHAAQMLHVKASDIADLRIFRRSLDARKKPELHWVYTVDVTLRKGEGQLMRRNRNNKITLEKPYLYRIPKVTSTARPVVVGFGPGGMFAALVLAIAGLKPIVLERGDPAPERRNKVETFWNGGALDPESNVQFGEGGAGTFSDGKLNTGTKNDRGRWILEQFVLAGAREDILYDAKPHVGTDVLFYVVQSIRQRIIAYGGEVKFGAKLTGFKTKDNCVTAAIYEQKGEEHVLPCEQVVLAIGHSARDTVRMLHKMGIPMEPKAFSMGVRIEHKQKWVDQAQYASARGPGIPPADYKLSCHLPDGSSAYTFCMCPGGHVVAAASQQGGIVTNGMSYADRDGENANAALLVTIKPEDFPDQSTLSGVCWQEELEQAAFRAAGNTYRAPAQRVEDFLQHRPSKEFGQVSPTYLPGVTLCDLHDVLPKIITDTLEQAIVHLDGTLARFADPDALMTGPETRSSSPVRILRGEDKQSALKGLYPCGEGAGYAGGIMSAAADGMACAEAILGAIKESCC